MAYQQQGFQPDSQFSDFFSRLWEMDTNKCYPDVDYKIDLQGCVSYNVGRDRARHNLFEWVDEEKVFSRKTYKTFRALLDNYELECGKAERVTREEQQENKDFIDAIMETEVMQETHKYLASKGVSPPDVNDFKRQLYAIWFLLIRRTKGDRDFDSSSFEHVFVGESREDSFIGLHNWIQFYIQEKLGNIDYRGYFKRDTLTDDEVPRLIALQFLWKGEKAKPKSSCFLGTSPEFEIAVYTTCFLLEKYGHFDCQLGEYEIEVNVKPIGPKHVGTAYIQAARLF